MTSGAPKWTRCGGWLGCTAGRSTSRTGTASLPPRHGGMDWNGVAHRRQFLLRGRVTRTAPVNLPQELRAGDAAHRHQLPVRIPPRFVALTFTASAYRPGSWPSAGGRPPCTLGPPVSVLLCSAMAQLAGCTNRPPPYYWSTVPHTVYYSLLWVCPRRRPIQDRSHARRMALAAAPHVKISKTSSKHRSH